MSCWRPLGEVRSGSWGRGGTDVLGLHLRVAAMLRTVYPVPDARIPCGEPLPPACACLAPTCQCGGTVQQKQVETIACVCAIFSVGMLVYHTSPSPTSAPPPTADMVRPATLHHGRRPQTPMSWQQGLCPALCPPRPRVFCSSREIIAPKLHGVASTILLIRVGVC